MTRENRLLELVTEVVARLHGALDRELVERREGGNSGHSLEPHLHLQVQDTPASNNRHQRGDGDSIPFRFGDITHVRDGVDADVQTSLFRRNDRIRTGP